MFECSICQSVFHKSRTHCPTCGAIPREYSMLNVPAVFKDSTELGELPRLVAIAPAQGVIHTLQSIARVSLRTVSLDYYADSEES